MTYGSLFTGIGGIDLGLDRAGMECRWQVEIDPFCRQVLKKHWPRVKRYDDIRQLTGDELEPVDLICGGFPCQDLSQAGKRIGIEGSRSGLWFEFARVVGMVGPRFVLIENVPGLLVPGAMSRVVGELARLGYVGIWRSLRASEFGAGHLRKRVFIVAYSNGTRQESAWTTRTGPTIPTSEDLAYREGERTPSPIDQWTQYQSDIRRGISSRTGTDGDYLGNSDPTGLQSIAEKHVWTLSNQRSEIGILADAGNGFFSSEGCGSERRNGTGSAGAVLSNSCITGLPDSQQKELSGTQRQTEGRTIAELCGAFAPGPTDPRWSAILGERPDLAPALESTLCGMADGLSNRLERAMSHRTKRLGRLGNAVVPQVAEWIGRRILEIEMQS